MDYSFNEQRRIFQKELSRIFDYIEMEEVKKAQLRMHEANQVIDEDLWIFMLFASYVGAIKRITYYRFVHCQGFDVRAMADAAVIGIMFQGVYQFELEPFINAKEVKNALNKTRYPKWTKIGLIGTNTRELVDLGEEFSQYMNELKEKEPYFQQLQLF